MHKFGIGDKWVFQQTDAALLDTFEKDILANAYRQVVRGDEFVYAPGAVPIMLVAHVDTVHRAPPKTIFYDRKHRVMWSPEGLGADDRAGVLGILEIIRRGHRPHVLLTSGEERGCTGAAEAARVIGDPGVMYVIELDRRNGNEAVFYDCANTAFEKYVLRYGFKKETGSFTDITTLCPTWGVAGVNLSCGYYNPHTNTEYLNLRELWRIVGIVERMLRDQPRRKFGYVARKRIVTFPARDSAAATPRIMWDDQDDWDYLGRVAGPGALHRYRCSEYPILIELDVSLLATAYGGSEESWIDWLDAEKYTLKDFAEEALLSVIDSRVSAGWFPTDEVDC